MRSLWQRFLLRALLALALALVVMFAPLGWLGPLARALQVPFAVILFVCFLGKLLYDTLFYDRYWP
jgi:hypothetical protein